LSQGRPERNSKSSPILHFAARGKCGQQIGG
jgi:hypothetical protein